LEETSISKGIRRIVAVTGDEAYQVSSHLSTFSFAHFEIGSSPRRRI
jgi:alanyl-tRNA synthetase